MENQSLNYSIQLRQHWQLDRVFEQALVIFHALFAIAEWNNGWTWQDK